MTDRKDDYEVGYGKPPKARRFAPGVSGNPNGRPRRAAKPNPTGDPRLDAGRNALIARIMRPVTIIENGRRREVSTLEAVLGSLVNTAVKGGVLAQRTVLQLVADEDARYREERQRTFDYWRERKIKAMVALRAAEKDGTPISEVVPHPDDIRLDYKSLSVTLDGPMDEAQAAEVAIMRRHMLLSLELSAWWEERFEFNPDAPARSRIGPFLGQAMIQASVLPPRMRAQTPEELEVQKQRMLFRRPGGRWETYITAECTALGVPFIRPHGPIRFRELKEFCTPEQIRELALQHARAELNSKFDEMLEATTRKQRKALRRSEANRQRRRKNGTADPT